MTGAAPDALLTQATRNSERADGLAAGALDEPLQQAQRHRVDVVRALLGVPFADFCSSRQHGWLAVGTAVSYLGSLAPEHGTWLLAGPCDCDACVELSWEPGGESRCRLSRMDGRALAHVRPASFTPLPR